MEAFDVFQPGCPSRSLLDAVVDRWGALVLVMLRQQPTRFASAARQVGGISDRMLSRTLKALVSDGLVERTAEDGGSRVEYALTDSGVVLAEALGSVVEAIYQVMPTVIEARAGRADASAV